MAKLRYAVVGVGALGGYYGARLQQSGQEVHFLLHSDYHHVQRHGLRVESIAGDFDLPSVYAYDRAAALPDCDVIIIALKTTQNHLLTEMLPALVRPHGTVLVLQNGLEIEEPIAAIVQPLQANVIGGLCFLCANKVGPGHIRHLDYGLITMGEYAPGYQPVAATERLTAIVADFQAAGIETQMIEHLGIARWRKLVWNIPFNSLSVILNATTDQMMADANLRELITAVMKEVAIGAKTCLKHDLHSPPITEDFIQEMLDHTEKMTPYLTSMKLDYDAGRPLEVEAILGNPLRAVARHGVTLPHLAMLYGQLKFLDQHRSLLP